MEWLSLLGLRAYLDRWRAYALEGAIAVDDRSSLFRLELKEYKRGILTGIAVAFVLIGVTIVMLSMLSVAVVVQFWDTPDRIMVAWIVGAVWAAIWIAGAGFLWSLVGKAGDGFSGTRRELAQDWHDIKGRL